jgi:hypothetical protein
MAVEKLSRTLERLLSAAGLPSVATQVSLARSWKRIAGPLLAGKASPSRFRHGVLTVHVLNASWAQELQMAKPVLLGRIGSVLGADTVRDIRFIVGPVSPAGEEPDRDAAATEESALPPLRSPEDIEEIPDPELRELLRSILEKSSRRKG